jgi:hypothetical protein
MDESEVEIDLRNIAGQLTRQHGVVYNMQRGRRPQARAQTQGPSIEPLAGMHGV